MTYIFFDLGNSKSTVYIIFDVTELCAMNQYCALLLWRIRKMFLYNSFKCNRIIYRAVLLLHFSGCCAKCYMTLFYILQEVTALQKLSVYLLNLLLF